MENKPLRLFHKWLAPLLVLSLTACDAFEYHPYAANVKFKNLTAENVAKIKALESTYETKPSFQFAFISDTQGFFAETADLVEDINNRNVAFVLHGGDLTNYAFTDEFERMHQALANLQAPYVTVIGNHDCLGDGVKLYQKMYGPLNHSFTFGQNKFVFLNTNYLELYNEAIPDLNWLDQELENTAGILNKFVIAHIPPNDAVANLNKEQAFAKLNKEHDIRLFLHGHIHRHKAEEIYSDGILYVSSASADKRSYILVTVTGEQVTYEEIKY